MTLEQRIAKLEARNSGWEPWEIIHLEKIDGVTYYRKAGGSYHEPEEEPANMEGLQVYVPEEWDRPNVLVISVYEPPPDNLET